MDQVFTTRRLPPPARLLYPFPPPPPDYYSTFHSLLHCTEGLSRRIFPTTWTHRPPGPPHHHQNLPCCNPSFFQINLEARFISLARKRASLWWRSSSGKTPITCLGHVYRLNDCDWPLVVGLFGLADWSPNTTRGRLSRPRFVLIHCRRNSGCQIDSRLGQQVNWEETIPWKSKCLCFFELCPQHIVLDIRARSQLISDMFIVKCKI